ncbi:MAG TPA: hypothetical protein VFS15_26350, partial [Kofleriaceae bacterium]|nr:hypothetical protein [Kofleriaceae bacterium]
MIEHRYNDLTKGLAGVACAFALSLVLAACGGGRDSGECGNRVCDSSESATSCPEDCGCGNNVINPGEDCDGPLLGDANCMTATGRGGTLRCNADCTFDVAQCTLASCGNGVAEEGESCDGADLGGGTCGELGYAGGDLACSPACVYDTSTCCSDTCPSAGLAQCVNNTVRECTQSASGCLAWQVTDCGATSTVCDSSSGTAQCVCVDRCATAGDTRCEGANVETCMDVGGCLDWQPSLACGTGHVCAEAASGPTCALNVSAEDCSDPYPLAPGENVVAWTALNADYLVAQPSCLSTLYDLEGPDLVLSYTAPEDGFVHVAFGKPANARQVIVASTAACGTADQELACLADYAPTSLSTDLAVTMGTTYYFYVRDTDSGTAPLDHPLLVTLDEALCSSLTPSVTFMSPGDSLTIPDDTPLLTAEFDVPVDPTAGVVKITGDMGTNLSYDLAMGPGEVAILNDGKTMMIDPGIVFPIGETLTVTWTGLNDATCGKPIAPPTWAFTLSGPPYSVTAGTTAFVDACVGGTVQTLNGSADEGRTNPINLPAGFKFFAQPAPQVVASTNGWLSVDTSVTSADFTNDPMPDNATPNGLIAPY